MTKNFYIFRHGQSSYNLENKIQGHSNNSVLTDQGVDQSYNTGHILKNKNIELVVSSPLRRAKQSGTIVSKVLKTPLHLEDSLAEANMGTIEGMNREQAEQKYKDTFFKWFSNNPQYNDVKFAQGESKKEVRERVFKILNKYANDSNYKNLAISGHDVAINQALSAMNMQLDGEIPNGTVIHLQFDKGDWKYMGLLH